VLDVEVLGKAPTESIQDRAGSLAADELVGHHHVYREHGHAGGDRPCVQVVGIDDPGLLQDVLADLVQVDAARGGLQQHVDRLHQQPCAPRQDHQGHRYRGDDVGAFPARDGDDHRCHDDRDGAEHVGEHLQVGTLDIEASPRTRAQDEDPDQVGDEADCGEGHHQAGGNLRWGLPALPGLPQQVAGDREEQQCVDDGGQDLQAVVAEGAPRGRWPGCEGHRSDRQADAGDIGEHVPGIRQQGQAAGYPGADDLDHQDDCG